MREQDKIDIKLVLKNEPTEIELTLLKKAVWCWTMEHALEPLHFQVEYNGKILSSYSGEEMYLAR